MNINNKQLETHKSYYFNNYKSPQQLLSLLICCFLLACNQQNVAKQGLSVSDNPPSTAPVININFASVEDLEKLPHIGEKTAREIVGHREKFGKFRKPEHLLLIRGISDKKFREICSFANLFVNVGTSFCKQIDFKLSYLFVNG